MRAWPVAVVAAGVAYYVAFPARTDYAGHFLAGAGGTLLLLAFLAPVRHGGPWRAVAAAAVAILLGVGTAAGTMVPVGLALTATPRRACPSSSWPRSPGLRSA